MAYKPRGNPCSLTRLYEIPGKWLRPSLVFFSIEAGAFTLFNFLDCFSPHLVLCHYPMYLRVRACERFQKKKDFSTDFVK